MMGQKKFYNPLEGFDFTILDDPEFKEDAVREEIIMPVLKALGYQASPPNRIIRSRKLLHPYVSIGSARKEIFIIPDYLMEVSGKNAWIMEAKGPKEEIVKSIHVEQAYSYAIHCLNPLLDWTFVGIDSDTKLVLSWLLGDRDIETATYFMRDVAERINGRVQITTDGLKAYIHAVDAAFPTDDEVDFAQLVKLYGPETGSSNSERKYSPGECTGSKKTVIYGQPDEKFISTSHVERQNLTMRMHMRRFTRLTNAFSKKIENHCYAIALHFVYYNFAKVHKSLRVTPAMQAGLTKRVMTIEDIVNLVPDVTGLKRGPYKKKGEISN